MIGWSWHFMLEIAEARKKDEVKPRVLVRVPFPATITQYFRLSAVYEGHSLHKLHNCCSGV